MQCPCRSFVRVKADVIDLAGALVLPGLHDAHTHIGCMGERLVLLLNLRALRDFSLFLGLCDIPRELKLLKRRMRCKVIASHELHVECTP